MRESRASHLAKLLVNEARSGRVFDRSDREISDLGRLYAFDGG